MDRCRACSSERGWRRKQASVGGGLADRSDGAFAPRGVGSGRRGASSDAASGSHGCGRWASAHGSGRGGAWFSIRTALPGHGRAVFGPRGSDRARTRCRASGLGGGWRRVPTEMPWGELPGQGRKRRFFGTAAEGGGGGHDPARQPREAGRHSARRRRFFGAGKAEFEGGPASNGSVDEKRRTVRHRANSGRRLFGAGPVGRRAARTDRGARQGNDNGHRLWRHPVPDPKRRCRATARVGSETSSAGVGGALRARRMVPTTMHPGTLFLSAAL